LEVVPQVVQNGDGLDGRAARFSSRSRRLTMDWQMASDEDARRCWSVVNAKPTQSGFWKDTGGVASMAGSWVE